MTSIANEENSIKRQAADAFKDLGVHDSRSWDMFVHEGFLAGVIPPEYGGNELGLLGTTIGFEELVATGNATMLPGLAAVAAVSVGASGSIDLKKRILPKLASGQYKVSVAATEPDAGFNFLNISTFAKSEGSGFVVNGKKTYVSGADISDLIYLIVRTKSPEECKKEALPKAFGLSVFLIDANHEGIEKRLLPTRGELEMKQFELSFNNVRIGGECLVGDLHRGAEVGFPAFNIERILFSALGLGISRFALDVACENARNRKVFKNIPIGSYQAIQHPLADAWIRQESLRHHIHTLASKIDAGMSIATVVSDANCLKYLSSELAAKSIDAAIEALGGRGFDERYGIIQLLEVSRLMKLSPLSNSMILNEIAERRLKLPRSY